MSGMQVFASGLLIGALVLFAWGRLRHDVVALLVLMLAVLGGLVPAAEAFLGFGHPAVITVAAVLVFSRALEATGVIGALARVVASDQPSVGRQLVLFCSLGAAMSGFVNNVGALAMLMPLAIATARRHGFSPSAILMPLSFATMLGGMTTLIGTPPNIIVSTYRGDAFGARFALFDFFPVGAAVAALGLLFLATIGWRLIPRQRAPVEAFEGVDEYVAELHVPAESELIDQSAADVAKKLEERDVVLLGVLRDDRWSSALSSWTRITAGDALLVEGAPAALSNLEGWAKVSLGAPAKPEGRRLKSSDTILAEVVLRPGSPPIGSTPEELRLRSHYRVNVLGVSREGARHFGALKSFRFQSGDVLLLQGGSAEVADAIAAFDALPLGDRQLVINDRRAGAIAAGAFAAALAAIALGFAAPAVALTAGAVVLLVTRVVRDRNLYRALDGPVLVVLAALIPVGQSLEASGVTPLIGEALLAVTAGQSAYVSLALVLIITMFVSDVINNAATAVVMAPIAATVAVGLSASPDPFLMAVAIGASCAFLTPIGHQNNLLVLGPGGYRFGDYWRMGLPLEALIVVVATWLLPIVWPFVP
jgi:di/tricarboxylate transporter